LAGCARTHNARQAEPSSPPSSPRCAPPIPDTNAAKIGVRARALRTPSWATTAEPSGSCRPRWRRAVDRLREPRNLLLARVLARAGRARLRTASAPAAAICWASCSPRPAFWRSPAALSGCWSGRGCFARAARLRSGRICRERAPSAIDLTVVSFALALALAVGLRARRAAGAPRQSFCGRGDAARLRPDRARLAPQRSARASLVAAEVGISLVLLVGAALLLRSLGRLQSQHRASNLQTGSRRSSPCRKKRYASPEALSRYGEELRTRLAALPRRHLRGRGVAQPAHRLASQRQVRHRGTRRSRARQGAGGELPSRRPGVLFRRSAFPCSPGATSPPATAPKTPAVALISKTLADRWFAGPRSPRRAAGDRRSRPLAGGRDRRRRRRREALRPRRRGHGGRLGALSADSAVLAVYFTNIFCVAVHTTGDPRPLLGPVRQAIRALDPDVAAASVRTMDDALWASLAERRSTPRCSRSSASPRCCLRSRASTR
jgi:hypothetical protein